MQSTNAQGAQKTVLKWDDWGIAPSSMANRPCMTPREAAESESARLRAELDKMLTANALPKLTGYQQSYGVAMDGVVVRGG